MLGIWCAGRRRCHSVAPFNWIKICKLIAYVIVIVGAWTTKTKVLYLRSSTCTPLQLASVCVCVTAHERPA